jgi:hypothetical protein
MPNFTVQKSLIVNVSVEKAFESVEDFRQWNAWWLLFIAEPDCGLTYDEEGSSYVWDVKIIGSGQMEILEELPRICIQYKLSFLKSWKSVSDVSFPFVSKENGQTSKLSSLSNQVYRALSPSRQRLVGRYHGLSCESLSSKSKSTHI